MIELRTFGGLEIRSRGGGLDAAIRLQTKRLVLLAYLASAPAGGLRRRDTLLALFWPDLDQEHARGALRQALHTLRKALGEGAVVTRGEGEIGLDPTLVTTDARALEAHLAASDPVVALSNYRGDFLEGVFVSDASPELEEWIAGERLRLRRVAAKAAWAAAAKPTGRGDTGQYVRRAVLLSGADEAALRKGIALLDQMGDRAAAAALFEEFASRVARDLDVEPSAESHAAMEAVRSRREAALPAGSPVHGTGTATPAPAAPLPPEVSSGMEAPAAEWPPPRRRLLFAGAIGAVLMLALAAVSAWVRRPALPAGGLVAVMPFRVSAADSGLAWLRDGMVELLSIRLTGEGGMQVAEPGRVLNALHRQAPAGRADVPEDVAWSVAADIGAGRIIYGSVTGTPRMVALSAWVLAPRDRVVARASAEGSPDSLLALVDRLAAQLLGVGAGIEASRLASFTSTSLPAVRAFLAGRTAFRTGRKEEAQRRFLEAVELDSNFALAGLDLHRTTVWVADEALRDLGIRRALAGRDRLGPADRALLDLETSNYDNAPEEFARWNAVVAAYPDRPETWYGLGDQYYHRGRLAGIDSALERAESAFRRGWHLDSAAHSAVAMGPMPPLVAEPVEHMVELAHIRGDSAEVRRLVGVVLAADSSSDLARGMGWHLASMQGESARRAYWDGIGSAASYSMVLILQFITATGLGAEDYPRASAEVLRRLPQDNPRAAPTMSRVIELNIGRPLAAATFSRDMERRRRLRLRVLEALSWYGDSAAASEAARELTRYAGGPAGSPEETRIRSQEVCTLGQWQMARGDLRAGEAASQWLRTTRLPQLKGNDSVSFHQTAALCAALLDAWRVSLQRPAPAARVAIAFADSLARTNIFQICCQPEGVKNANLILASLWERAGDPASALRALRRRGGMFGIEPVYHSSFLREEGRLAALTGDTAAAVRAYRHYLALRYDPEPSLRPAVDSVRSALAALERGY